MRTDEFSSGAESYERFLWNILCQRSRLQGLFPEKKAKRLAIMAYCLYYRGVTVSQIQLAKMSDSTDTSVIRATMAKYATSDIRCSIIPRSHLATDASGLLPVSESDAKKPYFMYRIQYGKQRINVYELSDYGLRESIYELLELPSEFLSGVTKEQLEQMGKLYRRKKSLQLSDEAAHLLATRDFGAVCYRMLNIRPSIYHTECRFFANGEFMSAGHAASHRNANASTVQISDGYVEFIPFSRTVFEQQSVYVEQDMGTQSRSYIRKNKLLHYLDFMRYSFRKHPALVTVLFSLQTRADYHYPKETTRPAPSDEASFRYAPSLRQEILIRAYENFGERWQDTLLSELRRITDLTLRSCPQVRLHLKNELALFDAVLRERPYATISELMTYISSEHRRTYSYSSSAGAFSVGDLLYYHQRRLEIFEESQRIPEFKSMLLEGFSVMFVPNRQISERIPCLIPSMSPAHIDGAGNTDFLQDESMTRLRRILLRITGRPVPALDYKPYISSSGQLFRNYYFNEQADIHLVVENLSDDLGGRARVLEYLSAPDFSLFSGIILCLVEADWQAHDSLSARNAPADVIFPLIRDSAYAHYMVDAMQGDVSASDRLKLRIYFITYQSFLSDDGVILELAVGNSGVITKELEEYDHG